MRRSSHVLQVGVEHFVLGQMAGVIEGLPGFLGLVDAGDLCTPSIARVPLLFFRSLCVLGALCGKLPFVVLSRSPVVSSNLRASA